jgi:transcriptional regulator with GAF, ATPase, and Fis domain
MSDQVDFDLHHLILIEKLFSSAWKTEGVRPKAIELVCSMMEAESASILVINPEKSAFQFEVVVGPKSHELKEYSIPFDKKSIARKVFEEEKTHIVKEFDPDTRRDHLKDVDVKFDHITRNMICSVIYAGDQKLGVLEVLNKVDGEFEARDKRLCELLSMIIGQALHISLLIDKIQKEKKSTLGEK